MSQFTPYRTNGDDERVVNPEGSPKPPPPKDCDPVDSQNILQSCLTFLANTTKRVLGTNQHGLRQKKRRQTDNDDEAKSPSVGVSLGGPVATAGGISFGGPVAPSPATPAFTFGAPVAPTPLQEPVELPRAPAFTFGSAAPAAAKPSVTFAATPKSSESIPSFSFASGSKTPALISGSHLFAGHTPGVSTAPFGGSSTLAPPFSFIGGSSTPVPPSYSFQAASTPATPSFGNESSIPAQTNPFSSGSTSAPSLGNTPGDTTTPSVSFDATPAPSISFSATSAQSSPFGTTPAPSLSFGCASPASAGVSFGASPAPSVSFGATPGFGTTPAPSVSFGGATPASAGVSFGAPAPEVAVGFGAAPAFGAAAATPAPSLPTFEFSQTPAQPTNYSFGAQDEQVPELENEQVDTLWEPGPEEVPEKENDATALDWLPMEKLPPKSILCSQGGWSSKERSHRPANRTYRDVIVEEFPAFQRLESMSQKRRESMSQKSKFTKMVIASLESDGYSFVETNKDKHAWKVMEPLEVEKKVLQAFHDRRRTEIRRNAKSNK